MEATPVFSKKARQKKKKNSLTERDCSLETTSASPSSVLMAYYRARAVRPAGIAQRREDALDDLAKRIARAALSTAPGGWSVDPRGFVIRTGHDEVLPLQYAFGSARRPVTWDWLRDNVTFFYQTPISSYRLVFNSTDLGIQDQQLAQILGQNPVAGRSFRTNQLEEIDTGDVVYFEVDLTSRFDVALQETFHQDHDREIVNAYAALAEAIASSVTLRPHIMDCERLALTFTYETHLTATGRLTLLPWTETLQLNGLGQNQRYETVNQMASAIIEHVAELVTANEYQHNGEHTIFPRGFRFTFFHVRHAQGVATAQVARRVRRRRQPAGGCLSIVNCIPNGLSKLLKHSLVSHDLLVANCFFDNNCGIREALVSLLIHGIAKKDIKGLYSVAARMRASTAGIPSFVKLTPSQVHAVLENELRSVHLTVYSLPLPSEPYGGLFVFGAEDSVHSLELVFFKEHYFSVNREALDGETASACFYERLRYCNRCFNYYMVDSGKRCNHLLDDPDDRYKDCAPRKKTFEAPHLSDDSNMVIDAIDKKRLLRRPYVLKPGFGKTNLASVGFMDLETYPPADLHGYHVVYAVGWIRAASEVITPEDVSIFSGLSDVNTTNHALIVALASLIAFVSENKGFTRKNPYYLYLYNGSSFDNLFIVHVLTTTFKMMPSSLTLKDGRIMAATYLGGCLVIRDLCLFTLTSLANACKQYGVEDHLSKGHLDHDSITSMAVIEEKWPQIDEYLRKDLTALNMVFVKFQKTCHSVFNLDPCSRITMSHLSYDYWISTLTNDQLEKVVLPASFEEYFEIRKSYYGGRVFPCVKEWKSTQAIDTPYFELQDYLIDLDVVSLYPSAMKKADEISERFFPFSKRNIPLYFCGDPVFEHEPSALESLFKLLTRSPVVRDLPSMDYWRFASSADSTLFPLHQKGAIVCVDFLPARDTTMILLPHKDEKGNTSWDLLPKREQWYVLEEILDAVYYGYTVTKIHCAYIYPHREALFDTSMQTLMDGKTKCKRGDPAREQYKLGANSIYGKHGQKASVEDIELIDASSLQETMAKKHVISIEPLCAPQSVEEMNNRRLNRAQWINGQNDEANPLVQFIDDSAIAVDGFVVRSRPKKILASKPTHLGAQVTAYSRIHMNWFMASMDLLRSLDINQQVFYTDTDSLIVHKQVRDNAKGLFGLGVGMLDDELCGGKIVDYVALAPKTYAIVYKMPDESLKMKIRCKGFPHTKETLNYCNTPLPNGAEMIKKLSIGKHVYELVDHDGKSSYYSHLSTDIFRMVLHKEIASVTVHFASMRRNYFGQHTIGHVAGIKHCSLSRSLSRPVWWDGDEEKPEPHRKTLATYQQLTFPVGHFLLD